MASKTTDSIWSNSNKVGTSTGAGWLSCPISTLTSALNNTNNVPSNAKITKIIMHVTADFDCGMGLANVYLKYGFGTTNSISKYLLQGSGEGEKFTKTTPLEYPEGGIDITSYLSKNTSPFAFTTEHGSYLAFRFYSTNVFSKTYYVNSLTFDITYEIPSYTITWANIDGKGGKKTTTVTRGTVPSYSGTPSKAADTKKEYTFSGWSPSVVAATGNATYTAQFTESPRTYYVFIDIPSGNCETSFRGQNYKYGDTITLNAYNFAEHTEFDSWRSYNGTKDWYSNPQTVTLNDELITHCLDSLGHIGFICHTKFKTYTIKAGIQPNSNAGFVQCSYYIDGVWYGGNAVTVPNEGVSFTYGDSNAYGMAFKATANEGYKFSKWSDGVTDNPRNIDTSRNITYTAIFENRPPEFTYAELKYLGHTITPTNKVICNEGFIVTVRVT